MKNRTHCTDHHQTNPCPGCRADHLAGEHATDSHAGTCRACRAEARAAAKPNPDPAAPRRTRTVLDVAALAAHDDTLTHLTEA